jgi:hypothetical protein
MCMIKEVIMHGISIGRPMTDELPPAAPFSQTLTRKLSESDLGPRSRLPVPLPLSPTKSFCSARPQQAHAPGLHPRREAIPRLGAQESAFAAAGHAQGRERLFRDPPNRHPIQKLYRVALNHFFDYQVRRHAAVLNPVSSVRNERYHLHEGKPPSRKPSSFLKPSTR